MLGFGSRRRERSTTKFNGTRESAVFRFEGERRFHNSLYASAWSLLITSLLHAKICDDDLSQTIVAVCQGSTTSLGQSHEPTCVHISA